MRHKIAKEWLKDYRRGIELPSNGDVIIADEFAKYQSWF